MKTNGVIKNILFGAAVLLMAGCDEDKYQLKFSHNLHVKENEMGCDECHGELGQPSFNAITHETCTDCHDEPDAEEIGQETCGICHAEKQLPALKDWTAEPAEFHRKIFVHTEELADKCQECHGALFGENVSTVLKLQRDDIVQIRNQAHSSGQDCLTCHVDMDSNQSPASHDRVWVKRHGQLGMQTDAACSVCHTEDSCTQCHSVMQPASHNNLWRLRSHGAVASWDRASCQVCHEEDSCTECHAQTRPRSHNARWGASGGKPTHCIGCHDTSTAGDGCATCHEGGSDISLHESYWENDKFDHDQLTTESCYICHWTKTP